MIPFDVDPTYYMLGFVFLIASIVVFVYWAVNEKNSASEFLFIACIFLALIPIMFLTPLLLGTTSTKEITICSHYFDNNRDGVNIMDENGNIYYTSDKSIQLRVKDGMKTNVEIATLFGGNDIIYKSDLPVTCGNKTCGATSS